MRRRPSIAPGQGVPAAPADPLRLLRDRLRRPQQRRPGEAQDDRRPARPLRRIDRPLIGPSASAGTCFFVGYLLLEIPGTLLVEKWSARKWICRIMVTWGIVASLTALVKVPWHFYGMRFLLGPGRGRVLPGGDRLPDPLVPLAATAPGPLVVPDRHADRAVHQPEALVLPAPDRHGRGRSTGRSSIHPLVLGLKGWQWVYIGWGLPSIVLGRDRPGLPDRPAPPGPLARPRRARRPGGRSSSARRPSARRPAAT